MQCRAFHLAGFYQLDAKANSENDLHSSKISSVCGAVILFGARSRRTKAMFCPITRKASNPAPVAQIIAASFARFTRRNQILKPGDCAVGVEVVRLCARETSWTGRKAFRPIAAGRMPADSECVSSVVVPTGIWTVLESKDAGVSATVVSRFPPRLSNPA